MVEFSDSLCTPSENHANDRFTFSDLNLYRLLLKVLQSSKENFRMSWLLIYEPCNSIGLISWLNSFNIWLEDSVAFKLIKAFEAVPDMLCSASLNDLENEHSIMN